MTTPFLHTFGELSVCKNLAYVKYAEGDMWHRKPTKSGEGEKRESDGIKTRSPHILYAEEIMSLLNYV